MKTSIILISILLLSNSLYSQDDKYLQAMKQTIDQMNNPTNSETIIECANQFERIARAEQKLWLPYYYSVYSLVVLSFEESDGGQKDLLLDRAQQLLDQAMELEPDESEIHVLQAFLYPSRILVDPMGRGMMYMEKMFSSLEKARALNENNPRIYFLEGVNKLNLPPSMGGGPEVAKPILLEAQEKFSEFENKDPLWPEWGEEATLAELEKL